MGICQVTRLAFLNPQTITHITVVSKFVLVHTRTVNQTECCQDSTLSALDDNDIFMTSPAANLPNRIHWYV